VHDLINEINRGPPRWITKKQALGLLYNAQMFSVSDINEDNKKDGLTCVIDSTKCPISSALGGYSVVANLQSSEKFIGKMKVCYNIICHLTYVLFHNLFYKTILYACCFKTLDRILH
jgi:hypothetical protein